MPKIVRTARGELVDFDALVIKQKIAEAPMNIEVARRKEFIDNKEGKVRGSRAAASQPESGVVDEIDTSIAISSVEQTGPSASEFEVEDEPPTKRK